MLFFFQDLRGHSNPGQNICSGFVVFHKHVTFMKYAEYYFNFLFKYSQLWLQNVCLFKENVGCFGVCCRKPFVMWTIKRVFAWQWKFMVALLCPNNSHIVSRTDSPAEEQQACYQSYIFAYCPASSLVFIPSNRKKKSTILGRWAHFEF